MIWTPLGECFKHIVDHCKVPVEKLRKERGKTPSLKTESMDKMLGVHQLDECPITWHPGSFFQVIFHMA
jgi:hypothetical protein